MYFISNLGFNFSLCLFVSIYDPFRDHVSDIYMTVQNSRKIVVM